VRVTVDMAHLLHIFKFAMRLQQ